MVQRATFKSFEESTKEEWANIMVCIQDTQAMVADRVIEQLKMLELDQGGFPVNRLEHCLQTATRALRDGRDEEYVVCALLHDIGDTLGTYDHGGLAAAILKPFVSEANHWMLQNHPIFQGYYYFEYLGGNKDAREKFADHPHYEHTKEFVELYDMPAFDSEYDSLPLEDFEPLVRRVMSKAVEVVA